MNLRDHGRLKRALRAYVEGHDCGWEASRKLRAGEDEVPDRPAGDVEWSEPAKEAPRIGIAIPKQLDFRRGPGRWRDRLRKRSSG